MTALVAYQTKPDLSPLLQAGSLAISIMKDAKVGRWSEFDGVLPEHVVLLKGQLELLREYEPVIMLLQVKIRAVEGGPKPIPNVTCYQCPECGKWGLLGSGTVPTKCGLSFGCEGKPVKAPAKAKKVKISTDDPVPSPYEDDSDGDS